MFSSALKDRRKTDYRRETKSVKQQKLHSGDDGNYFLEPIIFEAIILNPPFSAEYQSEKEIF
jgi:hypothetical protein